MTVLPSITGTRPARVAFVNFGGGSGDIVVAVALQNAFDRAAIPASVMAFTNNEFGELFSRFILFESVPPEPGKLFLKDRQTALFKKLVAFDPEVLIVFGSWLPVYPILEQFDCVKVLLIRQAPDKWFSVPFPAGDTIEINPDDYHLACSIEPNFLRPRFEQLNPVVIRNRDEILDRETARQALGLSDGEKSMVVARNGYEGEMEALLENLQISDPSYRLIRMTNRGGGGLFPLADYAKGIDLLVSGGGYSTFYESRFFGITAQLYDFARSGEDISWRLETNKDYTFDENGADQVVRRIASHM